jgi:mannose-6-phosphate isomerase-like protein (cupin superfamily)
MRLIVTGVKDGRTCVVEERACGTDAGMTDRLLDLDLAALPARPEGRGDHIALPVPAGSLGWFRIAFAAGRVWATHHTDTIDCHTIVSGSIELVLDDGDHRLEAGDCVIVNGVDHGWRTGDEVCVSSLIVLGTPAP